MCWYIIKYVWKQGKWIASDTYTGIDLVTKSSKGDRVLLKCMQVYKASKKLSVWIVPNSNKGTILNEVPKLELEPLQDKRPENP